MAPLRSKGAILFVSVTKKEDFPYGMLRIVNKPQLISANRYFKRIFLKKISANVPNTNVAVPNRNVSFV
jgi:hypothetical protein